MRRSLLFALAAVMLMSCHTGCHDADPAAHKSKAPVVRVAHPVLKEVTEYEQFTGRTGAIDYVQIKARVTGYLDKINFKVGSEVKAGDVLFVIDPRPYKAQYDRALGQVAIAESKLKLAGIELNRGLAIAKTPGAISQTDLDKLAADKTTSQATLQAAQADAEAAKINLDFCEVKSPVDGTVGENLLTLGNLITQDNTLLTTVVSNDRMYIYTNVDERTLQRVRDLIAKGVFQGVREGGDIPIEFGLATDQGYPRKGTIDFVNNQVDTGTGTLLVRGIIDNPIIAKGTTIRALAPGYFVRVRLPIGPPRKQLLVPESAIGTNQSKKFLYVVSQKNIVEYRPIDVGPTQQDGTQVVIPINVVRDKDMFRAVKEGEKGEPSIQVADTIIVAGLQRVAPGMTVDPKPAVDLGK